MARSGVAVHPGEASEHRRRSIDSGFGFDSSDDGLDTRSRWSRSALDTHSRWSGVDMSPSGIDTRSRWSGVDVDPSGIDTRSPLSSGGVPGRRTVTITGQGAEGYASRNGTRPSMAQRHRPVKRHERPGFRPDRVALWAVLLGVMLLLAAVTSAHAAALAAHHALALR